MACSAVLTQFKWQTLGVTFKLGVTLFLMTCLKRYFTAKRFVYQLLALT